MAGAQKITENRMVQGEKENVGGAQDYRFGSLPARAPLAMAYVPMQESARPEYDTATAFARGTLFPGLDLPFMNMINRPADVGTPEGELMALNFVVLELGMYLDTHKDDAEAFATYQSFMRLYAEGRKRYVELYGPITKADMIDSKSFTWLKNPWPWEYTERAGD